MARPTVGRHEPSLTHDCTHGLASRRKASLVIGDGITREVESAAVTRGVTVSSIVEAGLRAHLDARQHISDPPELPVLPCIADRYAQCATMDRS